MKSFAKICVFVCVLALPACGHQPTTAESMVAAKQIGTQIVKTTERLARQGKLTRKQVCVVQQYAKLFGDTMDDAFAALIDGQNETAAELTRSALKVINGLDETAAELAADACADGNPEG